MMICATLATCPFSYFGTFLPALRASAPVTATAGLGSVAFIDLIEPHAGVITLVLQHGVRNRLPPASSTDFAIRVLASVEAFMSPMKLAPYPFTSAVDSLCNWSFLGILDLRMKRTYTRLRSRAPSSYGSQLSTPIEFPPHTSRFQTASQSPAILRVGWGGVTFLSDVTVLTFVLKIGRCSHKPSDWSI